jgi:hypothetical protein
VPNQVTHRLVRCIRNPYRRQFAGAMQFRQRQRIPSVSLHPLACLERNQRGRDDDAVIPQPAQQSIQTIAAGTSLIAEVQVMPTTRQPFNHLSQHIDAVFECPKMANLTTRPPSAIATETVLLCTSSPTKMLEFIWPVSHA